MKDDVGKQKEESDQLWSGCTRLIWNNTRERTTELEIDGIQQSRHADTNTAVIAEALNITAEPEDIEISHKLMQARLL